LPDDKPKAKKVYRTGEKCPESGLWEHFRKEKAKTPEFPCQKLKLAHPAEHAAQ